MILLTVMLLLLIEHSILVPRFSQDIPTNNLDNHHCFSMSISTTLTSGSECTGEDIGRFISENSKENKIINE